MGSVENEHESYISRDGNQSSGGDKATPTTSTAPTRSPTQKVRHESCEHRLQTLGLMGLNFCSAVGIVVVNKSLFRRAEGLGFATFLTGLHFLATALGVRACHSAGLYELKPLKQTQVLPITLSFCAFVAFNNLSLQHNGVSFYQLMKILTTPAVVVLQLVLFKVVLPTKLLMALAPICLGVALATAGDSDVSIAGACWASAGLLAAAGYQVSVKSTQNSLKVSSLQLLHHQAPQAAGLILAASPVFDDTEALLGMLKNAAGSLRLSDPPAAGGGKEELFWVGMVFLSCLLAFSVNLSTFLVIERTSPVSYQVLGHFKLVVLLLVGVTVFGESSSPTRLAGMVVALTGIVSYTVLKRGLGSGWEGRGDDSTGSSGGRGGGGGVAGSGSGGGVGVVGGVVGGGVGVDGVDGVVGGGGGGDGGGTGSTRGGELRDEDTPGPIYTAFAGGEK